MDLYVMDENFQEIDIIENTESIIWKKCYSDAGSFEIYTIASDKYVALLKYGNYVIRHDDDMVGVIETIEISKDDDGRYMLLVSGRCAKALFARRIIYPQCTFSGTVWNRMYWMLYYHAVNPASINPLETYRQIPNTAIKDVDPSIKGPSATTQHTGTNLMDAVVDLVSSNNLGWKVTQDGSLFNAELISGIDRTIDQTDRDPVIFSDDLDNLISSDYIYNLIGYANVAHIAGEGEGNARIWNGIDITGTQSGKFTGLNRYELFVDARDLQKTTTNAETGDEITLTDAQYAAQLQARGLEKLAEITPQTFTGEVDIGSYQYRVDYDVGDLVTVRNQFGITANTRIVAVQEIEDEDGYTVTPEFSDYTITDYSFVEE